jgi:hypothetical protein
MPVVRRTPFVGVETMHPCRWVVYIHVVVVVSLMTPGLRGTAGTQVSDEDKVSFVWAFEALVAEEKVTK